MDTNAAYWQNDADGNLMVYNGKGEYLDTIPQKYAADFTARFNQGQRDLSVDYTPEGQARAAKTASGSGDATAWANVNLRGAELAESAKQAGQRLAEDSRQFNETFGMNKARGDQEMQLSQAKQRWQEAIDARDFEAANYWKARSQELQQNSLALDYTKTLAGLTGPQDWIKYGRLSRQESPLGTPDGKTVPLNEALPAWAQGFKPGTYPTSQAGFGNAAPAQTAPAPIMSHLDTTVAKGAATPEWTQGLANPKNLVGIPTFTPTGHEYYTDPTKNEPGRLVK